MSIEFSRRQLFRSALGFPALPDRSSAQFSESVSHAPYLHGLTPIALLHRQARLEMQRPVGLWGAYVMGLAIIGAIGFVIKWLFVR